MDVPIHDWARVHACFFHHFHLTWLFELAAELNAGILPQGYYALGEQVTGVAVPDVLALEGLARKPVAEDTSETACPEPKATITAIAEEPQYLPRPRVIAVRHVSGDRVVAIVEIVSPGNKKAGTEVGALVEQTVATLARRVHVLLIDLFPPGPHDPQGLHNVVWDKIGQAPTPFDPKKPLQVSSYRAGRPVTAYLEPLRVGDALPSVPLFLAPGLHVPVPLETSYGKAFARVPQQIRP